MNLSLNFASISERGEKMMHLIGKSRRQAIVYVPKEPQDALADSAFRNRDMLALWGYSLLRNWILTKQYTLRVPLPPCQMAYTPFYKSQVRVQDPHCCNTGAFLILEGHAARL